MIMFWFSVHKAPAAVRADRVVEVVQLIAERTLCLRHMILLLDLRFFALVRQIKLELPAAFTAESADIQRTLQHIVPDAKKCSGSPLLQREAPDAFHLSTAAWTCFHDDASFAAKSPLSENPGQRALLRGTTSGRRFLTKTASRSANTLLRDNGRTRHTPTAQPAFRRAAPGCIHTRRRPSRTDRGLS